MCLNDIQRMTIASLSTAASLALLPGTANAENHIACPAEIDANQVRVAAPAGWQGLYRPGSKALLRAARVWVGPLDGGAPGELIGETVTGNNGRTINRFPNLDLAPLVDGVRVPQDKWMVCTFGDEGMVLAMKLPATTKQCDVIYRRIQDPLERKRKLIDVLSDITCQ